MAQSKRVPWGKWALSLLLVSAGVGWYVKAERVAPPQYQTVTVTRGDIVHVVSATGQLDPVVEVSVGSQISGIVKRLFIDYNSVVKSNQVIAQIDPSTYEINVLQAKASLAGAKANLDLAKIQARRDQELFAYNLLAAETNDIAQAQLAQAQAQVRSDEAVLKNAQIQLSYCTIHAPINGVVISRNVDVGQTVAASFNAPLVAVIAKDLTKMQIDAPVSEADVGDVVTNQDVDFTVDAYPYRIFHGKVGQIRDGALTNENVINYDCVIGVHNPDLKLLPGMTANVSIITARRQNVLCIPNEALRFRPPGAPYDSYQTFDQASSTAPREAAVRSRLKRPGAGKGSRAGRQATTSKRSKPRFSIVRTVYVLPANVDPKDPGSARAKPVRINVGISDGTYTEVLSGLSDGEQVVTNLVLAADSRRGPNNPFRGFHHHF